ncbi:transposase [Volucribacter amazonae]|uniref:Transposase n=1 Tax=Volucribacter amazonae TaxID=256731 RepID=A0A9X4PBD4_9PAST|nr:transposase [Volucribacter amazonae]
MLMDSLIGKVMYHQIVKIEKEIYYQTALNLLRKKGYIIQSITYYGRKNIYLPLKNMRN